MKKEDGMRKYLMLLILTACLCFGRMSEKRKNRSSASAGDRSGKRNGIDGEDISSCR